MPLNCNNLDIHLGTFLEVIIDVSRFSQINFSLYLLTTQQLVMPHKIAKTKVLRYFFKLLVSPADDAGGSLHAKKQSVPFF